MAQAVGGAAGLAALAFAACAAAQPGSSAPPARPIPTAPLRPAPPAVVSRPVFDNDASRTDWIPFELRGNHIFLHVRVAGHDAIAGLDSGSTGSAIDRAIAAGFGLREEGAYTLHGSTGVQTTGRIYGVDLRIDNLTLRGMTLETFDMKSISGGEPLQFILGGEAFDNLVVEIDFAHRRLAFHKPDAFKPPPNAVVAPLLPDGRLRLAPVSIEGRPEGWFNFDLGDNSAVGVAPGVAIAENLLAGRPSATYGLAGVGGNADVTMASLHEVEFADVRFTNVPTVFPSVWPRGTYSHAVQGQLGVQLLSRFWLAIDFPHDRVFAVPNADATTAPFAKDRLGVMKVDDGEAFRVTFVNPRSPAEAAGIRPGDRVIALNGQPAVGLGQDAFVALADGPPGAELTFTMDNGAVRTVTLADYF